MKPLNLMRHGFANPASSDSHFYVAELEQEVRLWNYGVTLPTREDCWRQFRNDSDMAFRLQLPTGPNTGLHSCHNLHPP